MARLCQDRNWKSAVHLIEIDSQKRESEATRHLLQLFHKEELLGALGLGPLAWIVIEAQKSRLTPGIVGDVDILAGNLDFQKWSQMEAAVEEMKSREPDWPPQLQIQLAGKMVAESGGLVWPPKSSHVAGAEVKCAYFTDQIKSAKSSKDKVAGIRSQIDWLENMGLDRFALVDIVGTRISDEQSGGWLGAAGEAQRAREAMDKILGARLGAKSPAGQFVWSVEAVAGGDEGMRGAGGLQMLRAPQPNPKLASGNTEVLEHRTALLASIPTLFADLPVPRYFPVTFLDCRTCRKIHYLEDAACPLNDSASPGNIGQGGMATLASTGEVG